MEYLSKDNENPVVWKFKRIVAHQGPLPPLHKDYKGFFYNFTVEWENGEQTDEPILILAEDDLVSCVNYAKENDFHYSFSWKIFRNVTK